VEMRIEMRGKLAVAVPTEPVAGLTTEEVERIRREIREEREERWLWGRVRMPSPGGRVSSGREGVPSPPERGRGSG
jgi:hypothetical protein